MYYSGGLLEKLIAKIVGENLDWFFKKTLSDHYDRRRQVLRHDGGEHDAELMPAIDYVLKTCVDASCQYPPESVAQWHEWFLKLSSGYSHVFQQLFIIYLELDITNYLSVRERESTVGRQTRAKDKAELTLLDACLGQLKVLPQTNDFTRPLIRMSTGLWAMDNDQLGLMINSLSDPSIQLSNYFESPKELVRIVVGTLQQCGNPRMALFMSRAHRHENWDEEYDQMYANLLLSSGQLVEALKYERMFSRSTGYHEVLRHFFEICSKLDIIKSLNCLNLSVEEESALNEHIVIESSRPATPASSILSHHPHHHQTPNHLPHYNYSQLHHHYQPHQQQARRVTISESATPMGVRKKSSSAVTPAAKTPSGVGHTPRNRSVQQLRKLPSFSDSPARNTRSARKKKVSK